MLSQVSPEDSQKILAKLHNIEQQFNVSIILAVESGSRAWGFASPNSDYDVRFIYVRPQSDYLRVFPQRDVIDGQDVPITPIDDYVGWDIKKALTLMEKGNPQLFEWLNSPIVYVKDSIRFDALMAASQQYFSPIASAHHYLHMARGNIHEFLEKGQTTIPTKKYLYIIRPILACLWVLDKGSNPPLEMDYLLWTPWARQTRHVESTIRRIIEEKRDGKELGRIERIDLVDEFIFKMVKNIEASLNRLPVREKPPIERLDQLFREMIN